METGEGRFVGIDLAKKTYVARIESNGEGPAVILTGKNDAKGYAKLCKTLSSADRIAIEAGALGFWMARLLKEKVGCEVYVLNPGQLAIIYKSTKKTDLEDAAKLAWILRRFPPAELPVVPLPSPGEERQRQIVSELHFQKKIRTKLVNRLHSVFVRVGKTDVVKKDLETSNLRKETVKHLSGRELVEANRLTKQIDLVERQINETERDASGALVEDEKTKLLLTVPGVGEITAMAFLAYIGDGSRFACASQVSNYVGMTPRVYASGETVRLGRISKRGCSAIRSIIVQSAWAAVRAKNNRFRMKYDELKDRIGKKKAIVAIARRMIEVMWIVVRKNEQFRDYDEKSYKRKLRILYKKAQDGKTTQETKKAS